jgi:hypothetical protein
MLKAKIILIKLIEINQHKWICWMIEEKNFAKVRENNHFKKLLIIKEWIIYHELYFI